MRHAFIVFISLVLVGCATRQPVAVQPAPPVRIAAALPTKTMETRYEVRGYREAVNPTLRHEAHAVYRRSQVPLGFEGDLVTVSRTEFPPASYAPLPAGVELAAELATQKTITADLRAMQQSMAETEKQVRAQYATLVRQSAETLKVREQLDAERMQLRAAATPQVAPAVEAPAASSPTVKW